MDAERAETPLRLRVLDTRLELRLSGAGVLDLEERVRRAWCRCVEALDDGPADVVLRVVHDGSPDPHPGDLVDDDLDRLMHRLSPLVTMTAAGHQAGRLLMLHAAGLADPDTGATVGLVAPSGTGKTTLCATLGRTWGYLTDETLAIRDDHTIAAYPKPLSVVVPGAHVKDQRCLDDLGLLTAPAGAHLAGLAVLERDGSTTPWLESVPTVRALARLSPESSYLARLTSPLHRLATAVESVGGLRVLHYAEAADLEPVLRELVAP